jgi:hypothetical protein
VVLASSFWWTFSLNLEIAERDIILPRIVQVLGAGIITVPLGTIIFRFLPKTESSQAAGLNALIIARSKATQHIRRECRNSLRPPRTSHIPSSGSRQCSESQRMICIILCQPSYEGPSPYLLQR